MQQVLVPGRPESQCHYWDCSLALTPFCSHDHAAVSQAGEQSAAAIVVVDGTTEAHSKFVSLKCLRGKLLDNQNRYGIPILPAEVLDTPPWLQPGVFDWNLRPMEATRQWLFMTIELPPARIGQYWQHYDTRNAADYRRTRWGWYKRALHQHTGYFSLTLFTVPNSPVAVYWLLYKPAIPGQKGSVLEAKVVPAEKNNPTKKGEPPSGSKRQKKTKGSGLGRLILGSASNPLQVVCLGSQSQQTKGYDKEKDLKPHNGMDLTKLTTKEQVIILQKQLALKPYMKVFSCSYSHNVALKGYIITFVSADAETDNPLTELKAGIDLFGPDDEIFFYMCCDNEPASDNCMGYDASTHFETTVADLLNMYSLITGNKVLHMDMNDYCGGESKSLNLSQVLLSGMMPKLLNLTVDSSAASAAEE